MTEGTGWARTPPPPGGRVGGPGWYPVERPDFEPPPQWAQPGPHQRMSGDLDGPMPSPRPFGAPEPSGRSGTGLRRGVLIALAAVIALIFGTVGAFAGVLGAIQWYGPLEVDGNQAVGGDLGAAKGSAFPKPQDVQHVADAVLPGVVQIKVDAAGSQATGSGFVLRKDGYILTNNHVVAMADDGAGSITVAFHGEQETSAKIVGRSPSYDLAVIKVERSERLTDYLKPLPLGDSDQAAVGEPVVAIGSPLGLTGTVTSGILSARDRAVTAGGGTDETSFISALQTDAAINPGNSGGPLVNLRGEVIGVNSAIATLGQDDSSFGEEEQQGSIGLGFAIPMDQARRTAGQLIESGYAVYPVVGASVDQTFEGPGARIVSIVPGSGADRAGIRDGDLVTVINGHKVTGADDLIVQIRSHQPGERVRITYERGNDTQDVLVTLGRETD